MSNEIEELARKMAPVQGYSAGIPWSMHLRAYDVYCKRYGPQKAMIEGGCRGGFGTGELDMFIPGWREELSEMTKLKAERDALKKEVDRARIILAGTDIGSLPNDHTLEQMAQARMNDLLTAEARGRDKGITHIVDENGNTGWIVP